MIKKKEVLKRDMRIRTNNNEFKKAVSMLNKIVPRSPSMPILSCLYIKAEDNKIILRTSNNESSMMVELMADVLSEGAVAIPCKDIYSITQKNKDNMIEIAKDREFVTVKASATYKLVGMYPEDFPIPDYSKETVCHTSISVEAIKAAAVAYAEGYGRRFLEGLCFNIENDCVEIVSTNTYKLAYVRESNENDGKVQVIIPASHVLCFVNSIDKPEVGLTISEKNVCFVAGHTSAIFRVIDDQYIDYGRILSATCKYSAIVDRAALLEALDRAMIFSNEHSTAVLDFSDDVLTIISRRATSESKEQIGLRENNIDFNICVNVRYVVDGLKAMNCGDIKVRTVGENGMVIFSPTDNDSFKYLVMPVKVRDAA